MTIYECLAQSGIIIGISTLGSAIIMGLVSWQVEHGSAFSGVFLSVVGMMLLWLLVSFGIYLG